ncbi:MAG TPA: hypothetical protein VMW87_04130, partial [Spirochaetia bacterium]|nr:hypothetical protein [Spirochaetia bacterium]
TIGYQSLGLRPDLSFGKFGVGLNLTLNYRFNAGPDQNQFEVRKEDWVPDANMSLLELYLPKIRYVRWDHKGAPLYILLGQVDNGILGNGFIMGGYTNTQFLPQRPVFGLSFDVDGALFGFPYVGIETFAANLAAWDLLGGRFYIRPLKGLSVPVIQNLQIGSSVVVDRNPFYFAERDPQSLYNTQTGSLTAPSNAQVFIWGLDTRLPILTNPVVSLALYGDFVQQKRGQGEMVGAGGRFFGIITYGAQMRFVGENFIPDYFDSTYDLYRVQKYSIYTGKNYVDGSLSPVNMPAYTGWLGSIGLSILDDKLSFIASMDGAFNADFSNSVAATFAYPHLRAVLTLAQGIIPGFAVSATYDKFSIDSWNSLVSADNAVIGARIDYKTGPAVISLVYDLKHNTTPGQPWTVTSRLETTITLF